MDYQIIILATEVFLVLSYISTDVKERVEPTSRFVLGSNLPYLTFTYLTS
jgi:hypothetical protein